MRIKDRLLLGIVAGLGGNMVKMLIMNIARKLKWAEFDGAATAGGMLLPAHKLAEPRGKLIGYVGDAAIAGTLGVATTYLLSVTGKDKAPLKGAFYGLLMWNFLYGAVAGAGISKVKPATPKTVLSQFIAHSAYGALTAELATRLGDPGLFTGEIPLSASSQNQSAPTQHSGSLSDAPVYAGSPGGQPIIH